MKRFKLCLLVLTYSMTAGYAQSSEPVSLKGCIGYSLENNATIQKDKMAIESARQSKREVLGSMLPQINAQSSFTYNIQKTTVAMPNFMQSMLPESMRDPDADKYMTVAMGMDLSANWGVSLTQQLLNFSLFNAIAISGVAKDMAEMGAVADREDLIAKTATLYYNAQILQYSLGLFDESLELMRRMSDVMESNRSTGIVRNVDADRIAVTRMNLETEKSSLQQALQVQLNLLKLQMGFPMDESIEIEPADISELESMVFCDNLNSFEVEEQIPFKMLKYQQDMLGLQRKAAISESLPTLSLSANYSENYMGDHFYGETYQHFPVSMVSLNLRIPILGGFSRDAKIKKAGLELKKAAEDEKMLVQSLTMGYNNARMQMEQNRRTIDSQRRNQELAQEVLKVTESNYNEGISSLSDLLNASSSLIQARMNYINALSSSVKSHIDLKKADGSISEIINQE